MRLLLSKFCEYATQLHNGRQTLVGVFDNIVVPFLPVDHPPFFLCVQMEFEPDEAGAAMEVEALLIDEDARHVLTLNATGEVPRDPGGSETRVFITFLVPPLKLEHTGMYRLDLLYNGKKIGEERLPVLCQEPQGQSAN